jgi:hypothetical protein
MSGSCRQERVAKHSRRKTSAGSMHGHNHQGAAGGRRGPPHGEWVPARIIIIDAPWAILATDAGAKQARKYLVSIAKPGESFARARTHTRACSTMERSLRMDAGRVRQHTQAHCSMMGRSLWMEPRGGWSSDPPLRPFRRAPLRRAHAHARTPARALIPPPAPHSDPPLRRGAVTPSPPPCAPAQGSS